jgi:hypothetical protein
MACSDAMTCKSNGISGVLLVLSLTGDRGGDGGSSTACMIMRVCMVLCVCTCTCAHVCACAHTCTCARALHARAQQQAAPTANLTFLEAMIGD